MFKRIYCIVFILCAGTGFYGFAQEGGEFPGTINENLMLARSSHTYRVTPGDVYTLIFMMGANPISYTIVVDTSYRIRVVNMGIINAAGRTFAQIRTEVENLVARNHPLSGPQLILTQPAIFRVFVDGEVYQTGERSAWGLTRLSSLVSTGVNTNVNTGVSADVNTGVSTGVRAGVNLTRLASLRDITIRSADGQVRVFDLFRFWRFGDQAQNPYLRPGDVITFNRVNRLVTITGEVERPGTYQILAGENLRELIELYGNNFTPFADRSRITLTRFVGSGEISGEVVLLSEENIADNFVLEHMDEISIANITDFRPAVQAERIERTITISGAVRQPGTFELLQGEHLRDLVEVYGGGLSALADPTRIEMVRRVNSDDISGNLLFLTQRDLENNFALEHLDAVFIPENSDLLPVLFVEGAVGVDITDELLGTTRVTMQFHAGDTFAAMVRRNREWFSAVSDTENAYVIRSGGEIIPLNLNLALFDASYHGEVLIRPHDTLIIPFRQFFVTVAGAVNAPGRFPFIPDRGWEYYVALAGGFVAGRNIRERIDVTDMNGRRLRPTDPITPETIITARTNHPMFLLTQYIAPVFTIVTSLVGIILAVR